MKIKKRMRMSIGIRLFGSWLFVHFLCPCWLWSNSIDQKTFVTNFVFYDAVVVAFQEGFVASMFPNWRVRYGTNK